MLEMLAANDGMADLLAFWEMTLMCRVLTTGQYLPPVDFPAAPGLLTLSARCTGLPELLAPC
jgi:hypothetical protein